MSSFGVIPEGFSQKALQDVLDGLVEAQRAAFGPTINTQADSVLGQLNGIYGVQLAELWELAIAVYRAQYPDSASDEALDNVAALTGAIRLAAAPSTVTLSLNLDNGTTVPITSVVSVGASGARWETLAAITNSTGAQSTLTVAAQSEDTGTIVGNAQTIDTIQTPVGGWVAQAAVESLNTETFTLVDLQTLLLSVDGGVDQTVTFNTANFADIANATAAEVASEINGDTTGITASDANTAVRIVSDTNGAGSSIEVTGGTGAEELGFTFAESKGFNFSTPAQSINGSSETYVLVDGENLSVRVDGGTSQLATFNTGDFVAIGAATAVEVAKVINTDITGVQAYRFGSKVQIESLTVGTNSRIEVVGGTANGALNFQEREFSGVSGDATPGRVLEADPDFRLRREQLLQVAGAGTLEAIRAEVRNATDVTQAVVFENATGATDAFGRPPHSFEVLATGGTDPDVAQAIFDSKPIGIETFRDPGANGVTEVVTDSQSIAHTIEFSRPEEIQMHVEVDVIVDGAAYGGGDQAAGDQQVKEAIKDLGDTLLVGEDVIAIRFKCAPLDITGVTDVTLLLVEDSDPPLSATNFVIDDREQATFSTADVDVNVTVV